MSAEENEAIDRLLDADATTAKQKAALKWFAEYLEEGYILNLPPSKAIVQALETFSKRATVEAALKTRAKNLIKKYRR
ncbi:MAG: hypothetical protein HRT56_05660 [Coraliomargarita sp.]|nr:hypothetical protein [Coraliomargarita sp.]